MADSWEDVDEQQQHPPRSSSALNAGASTFTFNPSVASWTPPASAGAPGPSAMQSAQAMAQEKVSGVAARMQELSITSAPRVEDPAETHGGGDEASGAGDEDTDEIDENDPLWKATLQAADGDREKAMKMLEDPDALMANAEVQRIIAEGAKDSPVEIITEAGRGDEAASRDGTRPNGTAETREFA